MKFVDQAKIHLQAGHGGNGCSSFRREKFVPRGGPDGGDGGKGGDIYFVADEGRATLLDFQYRQHHKAASGTHGMGKDRHGRGGEDLVVAVPPGTIVRDLESGEVLLEVLDTTPRLCLRGGRGGRGNTRFRTSTHRAPEEWEPGEPGEERWVLLELKLMADVGLVGFPNAGKSTLISRVSRAHPKIADYPFTTLVPNLGVVSAGDFESFVMADIPGIIAGAHEGAGLGDRFLKHIERTAMLLVMVPCITEAEYGPLEEYRILLGELTQFSPALLEKPRVVALTKTDLLPDRSQRRKLERPLEQAGERVFPISAVTGEGIDALVQFLGAEVRARRASEAPSPAAGSAPSIPRS